MDISIIIPTYKPENYIYECLSSIVHQTYDKNKFELIIVLNGPQKEPFYTEIDSFICDKGLCYKLLYSSIPSVSNARNIGIKNSSGTYICFIDDDDYVSDNYIESLLKLSYQGYVPLSNVLAFKDDNKKFSISISEVYNTLKKNNSTNSFFAVRKYMDIVCCKIIEKKVIGDTCFNLKYKNGEDSLFMFTISKHMKKFVLADDDVIYYRRIREGSATTKNRNKLVKISNAFNLIIEYTCIYFSNPLKYSTVLYLSRVLALCKSIFY